MSPVSSPQASVVSRERRLREMLSRPSDFNRVWTRIVAVVGASFRAEREGRKVLTVAELREPPRAEVKRRVDLLVDWFAVMRFDCHFSTARALDELPNALRAALAGEQWEPPRDIERAWTQKTNETMVADGGGE